MASLTPETVACLREAGRIASEARLFGAGLVRAGALLREVCAGVEERIRQRGGQPAFPVQSSRNAVAAHYCPAPDDETVYAEGDLAKLDIGVHVEGWVVDTALTVNVGDRPGNRPLIEAAEAALEAAIDAMGPGVPVQRVSQAIERAIRARGFRPVANLCGHGVGRWIVHCPPPVPNVAVGATGMLVEGSAVAVEPFATAGAGRVHERGRAEVFRLLDPAPRPDAPSAREGLEGLVSPGVLARLQEFRGLPFARRQFAGVPTQEVEAALSELRRLKRLVDYPPLVEPTGAAIAQAEHTLLVGASGVEVLTR